MTPLFRAVPLSNRVLPRSRKRVCKTSFSIGQEDKIFVGTGSLWSQINETDGPHSSTTIVVSGANGSDRVQKLEAGTPLTGRTGATVARDVSVHVVVVTQTRVQCSRDDGTHDDVPPSNDDCHQVLTGRWSTMSQWKERHGMYSSQHSGTGKTPKP